MLAASKANLVGVALFILALCVLQNFAAVLEFDRQQILAGQVWRLWTGHFVHSHASHLALNAISAVALYWIFALRIDAFALWSYGFFFSFLISIVLLGLYPDLAWYNGLSGLLHALFSCICVHLIYTRSWVYGFGLIAVWSKVLLEMWRAHGGYQGEMEGMAIIIEAHFIGVVVGTFTAVSYLISKRIAGLSS